MYSGFLLCLLSTSTHLMITLPLNQQMQYRIINIVNDEIAKNPILKSNPKSIKPKGITTQFVNLQSFYVELKPVELYPFNLIFATLVSFVSKTITYPIDTLKYFNPCNNILELNISITHEKTMDISVFSHKLR